MKKILTLFLVLFVTVTAYAQDITRHEVDSLLRLLDKSLPDTGRINVLLQLAKFQIFKPGEYKQDLDSGAAFIQKAKVLNATLKSQKSLELIILIEAFLIKERGQVELSKQMVEKVVEMISKEKDKSYLADAYFELSDYYDYTDPKQLIEKINLVERAVSGFQQMGNKESQASGLKVLADLYDQQGEHSQALEKINLSLEIYKSINYTQLQAVYILFGTIYFQLGNYDKVLYYELLALKSAEDNNDTTMNLCQMNNVIGSILARLGEREKAINYLKTALRIAEKYNDNRNVILMLMNITDCYIKLKMPEKALKVMDTVPRKFLTLKNNEGYPAIPTIYLNIYSNLKNYRKAQVYANEVVEVIKSYKTDDRNLHNMYNVLIKYYISSGQLKAAGIYLKKSDLLSRQIGDPDRINRNTYLNFQLDTAQGDFKSAVYDLLTYNKVADSLFNETKSKQIKQLEIDFETQKKEDSLKIKDKNIMVLNQQNRLQQSFLARASLVRNITFGGIGLLFVIMGLLYRQYRLKQQTSRVIKYKNEMLEHLLKEVHHRVKNNLHTVICLLESQAAYLENDALKAIETSQHRIYAMSLIHQKLYQSEDVKTIDMSVYLPEFVRYLNDSFDTTDQIDFQLDIEPLQLGITQAIPIALIINEAVTNSIKYAFPDERSGIIEIKMHQTDKQIRLTISDNGVGIETSIANAASNTTLGLELIKGLSEDINAHIRFENYHGTRITMLFKVDPLDNRTNILNSRKEKQLSL